MPQVVAFGVDGEALTYVLIVSENIVEEPCNCISFFELV